MKPVKIVYIGAGSLAFGPKLVSDAVLTPEIKGARLVLMDVDQTNLDKIYRLGEKMNAANGAPLHLEKTTNRQEALKDADFVIISIAMERFEHWKQDIEIPRKYGIYQAKAETGGPGGISLILRNMPVLIDIARDVERLAPHAWVLNYTNPVNAMMYGINKYTAIHWIGLCDGMFGRVRDFARLFETDYENIDLKVAGINHCVWHQDARRKDTGEDLLAQLPQKLKENPDYQPLSQYLMKVFGLFPGPGDHEIGEFFPFGMEFLDAPGFDYTIRIKHKKEAIARIEDVLAGRRDLEDWGHKRSEEIALDFIADILLNRGKRRLSGIVENQGNISNLPYDAIVEVPIMIDAGGVHPLKMHPLPEALAKYLTLLLQVQKLAVEAAMTGSRELALQALLLEPSVTSAKAAGSMLDEFLEVHRDVLPEYWYK
ncbi:MAG: alpha-glucosidase/alpha-galactosidase [Calditrichaeota bacterium]|nr:alpha-glucosidase/alpha-galactosidase [Calditrichota bacterium]